LQKKRKLGLPMLMWGGKQTTEGKIGPLPPNPNISTEIKHQNQKISLNKTTNNGQVLFKRREAVMVGAPGVVGGRRSYSPFPRGGVQMQGKRNGMN